MAYSVIIQPTAEKELRSIFRYLNSFGKMPMRSFRDEWKSFLFAVNSGTIEYRLSRFEPLADRGYHSSLVKNYVVLFYYEDDKVYIAHVFHQAQDYASIVLNG